MGEKMNKKGSSSLDSLDQGVMKSGLMTSEYFVQEQALL